MARAIRHGFRNVHYAPIISDETSQIPQYGAPIPIAGAVSFSPSRQGGAQTVYADDTKWFSQTQNTGGSGDITFTVIPDNFLTDILGYYRDKNKVLVEVANAAQKPFALLGEVQGEIEPIRFIYYYCSASPIKEEYETNSENYNIKNQSFTLDYSPIDLGVEVEGNRLLIPYGRIKRSESKEAFDDFFTTIYIPQTIQGVTP